MKSQWLSFSLKYANFASWNFLWYLQANFIQMIYLDELPINLNVCYIWFLCFWFRSKLEPERSFPLPNLLWKTNFWKFIYGFFNADWYRWSETDQLNFTIRMVWFLGFMCWLFHHLNLTRLFPNVFYTTHVTVDIQSNDVLKVVQRKRVIYVVDNIVPANFHIKDVVSN